MKYVRVRQKNGDFWGILQDSTVKLLSAAPYLEGKPNGVELPLDACRLLAPCQPTKIVCVGKNYYDHAMELGGFVPANPVLFLKGLNTLNHPEAELCAPDFVTQLDYEGELAFVVKKRARRVRAEDYADYILGYTCLNDVTARDIQALDGQWTRAKSMDGFCPMGPWLTDEIDASCVSVTTRLNGRIVQRGNTAQFMHSLPQLLEFITAGITLEPGDVVTTGTPAGVGPMEKGDTVEVEIQGIGVLRNHVV